MYGRVAPAVHAFPADSSVAPAAQASPTTPRVAPAAQAFPTRPRPRVVFRQAQGWFSADCLPLHRISQTASRARKSVVPPDPGPTTNSTNNLIVGLVHVRTCIGDSIGTNTDAVTNSVTNSCKHRPMKHQPGTAVTRNMIRKHAESLVRSHIGTNTRM